MKLVTFVPRHHWQSRIGHLDVDTNRIIDLNAAYTSLCSKEKLRPELAVKTANLFLPADMLELIRLGSIGLDNAMRAVDAAIDATKAGRTSMDCEGKPVWYSLNDVTLKAPIPRPAGMAIGFFNTKGIIEEASRVGDEDKGIKMAVEYPKEATISWGHPSTVIGPGEAIVFPRLSKQLFNSIELGLVIGKDAYQVPLEQADEYILGYTVTTDITAFDLVQQDNFVYTVTRCKDMPTFWPTGPWIVTADEVPDPMDLSVAVRVNGKVAMNAHSSSYVFSPRDYVHDVSKYMLLEAGTIIGMGAFTGTTTDSFIEVGDVVENEIEKVGVLTNTVVAEEA